MEFLAHSCAECYVMFGITEEMDERLRKNHVDFYCPMGHAQSYTEKTTLDLERERRLAAEKELKTLRGTKKVNDAKKKTHRRAR